MANRKQRREAQFGRPLHPSQPEIQKPEAVEPKDVLLWCLAGVMALALLLVPTRSPIWVLIVLLAMVCLGVHPVLHLPWVRRARSKRTKVIRGALGMVLAVALVAVYGWLVWPAVHRHTLSKAEREKFKAPLMGPQNPEMSIQLACAPGDEVDCEYAADLIPLFGEAGWKVSGEVQRITLIRPPSGITLGLKGGKPETERNWNSGAWTALTPTLEHVQQAFANIGIEPESTSGSIIPENQINIYVGHERDDESSPNGFTRSFEQMHNSEKLYGSRKDAGAKK